MKNDKVAETQPFPIQAGKFAIRTDAKIKIDPQKTKLTFKHKDDQVEMTLSLRFEKDDQNICIGGGNVDWKSFGEFDFDETDEQGGQCFPALFFFVKNPADQTVSLRSNNSDFEIATLGKKQDHGNSARKQDHGAAVKPAEEAADGKTVSEEI